MNITRNVPGGRQQGAALVISLIFLVMLTMLGVSVASNNTLQERMASNTRQHDLAFQQAEAALHDADAAINDTTSTLRIHMDAYIAKIKNPALPTVAPLSGVRTGHIGDANDAAYWQDATEFDWLDASCVATTTNGNLDRRYMLDYMGSATDGTPAVTKYYYRVTARGTMGTSTVILQSMYKFE